MKLVNTSATNNLAHEAKRTAALLLLFPFLLTLTLPQAQARVTIKRLNPPGSAYASASAVNNMNEVVGSFTDSAGVFHGFIYDGTKYKIVTHPKATSMTQTLGINDSDVISGTYFGKDQFNHGFFLRNGKFTSYDVKKGFSTYLFGINNAGNFAGYMGNQGDYHGFVSLGGKLTILGRKGSRPQPMQSTTRTRWWAFSSIPISLTYMVLSATQKAKLNRLMSQAAFKMDGRSVRVSTIWV